MATIRQFTKLNAVKIHLLKMFARPMNEQDLTEVKTILSKHNAQKVDSESGKPTLCRL